MNLESFPQMDHGHESRYEHLDWNSLIQLQLHTGPLFTYQVFFFLTLPQIPIEFYLYNLFCNDLNPIDKLAKFRSWFRPILAVIFSTVLQSLSLFSFCIETYLTCNTANVSCTLCQFDTFVYCNIALVVIISTTIMMHTYFFSIT